MSISKWEIVERLAKERRVEQMIENICKTSRPEAKDLAQMVYLICLEYEDAKIVDLWENGQINYFLVRVIRNQFFSAKSPFWRLYHRELSRSVPLTNEKEEDD